MKVFFRRLPLRTKLLLIAVIPLALLIYFALQIFNEKNDKLEILQTYLNRSEQAAVISNVVEKLQRERRYSFGYALTKDWKTEMLAGRMQTDQVMAQLNSTAVSDVNIIKYTFLDSLAPLRSKLDRDLVAPSDVMNFYTNSIFRLNTLNNVSVARIKYLAPVDKDLVVQKLLSEMITYFGIMRSNIYYILYTSNFNQQLFESLQSLRLIYGSYEMELREKASDSTLRKFDNLVNTGSMRPTLQFLDSFLKKDMAFKMDSEDWWNTSSAGVDEMMQLQRSLLSSVQAGIFKIFEDEKKSRNISFVLLLVVISLVILIVVYTLSVIQNSLTKLNVAAQQIAMGETGIQIQPESDDVIGSLSHSFLLMDENNRKMALAAHAIGSGNFSIPIEARGEKDVLGNAVIRMKADLQRFNIENEEKLWIHEGIARVSESIRGEKTVENLVNDALHTVADYCGAQAGIAYVKTNGHLNYQGGYAVVEEEKIARQISSGQTLIGLAEQKKEIIQLEDLPEDYIKIGSGSGHVKPRNILLVPLVHNGKVEAVFELASLQIFPPAVKSFFLQVQSSIAIAIEIARNRSRLQELLEETQAQGEELQAQHSELENINAELEAQAEKLQASEEELKVQQEELMQANNELEERSRLLEEKNQIISERNIDIQRKAEELELSSKYKSEFLANMSHELRTPLNSILLLSRLLSENKDTNLSEDQVQYANVIQSSGRGLLSLIDDILDLSKIEAGKMEVEFQPVSLREIADDMEVLFVPMAKEKKIDFGIEISPELPVQIETDKLRMEQILKNLLSNAIKFTSEGSVKLEMLPYSDPSMMVFAVKDTGIGIPAEKQQLIFEAFQQADGSTRRKFGGTGLGLSISRELIKLLGGDIKVSSEPGKGSDFRVIVPLKKLSEVKVTPEQEPSGQEMIIPERKNVHFHSPVIPENLPDDRAEIKNSEKTILIIEDDTAFAKALMDYTHRKGYKALVAVRGDEGIELARQFKPMGILLDIQLPVKDGWEVMEELKRHKETRHIPVHIMSSHQVKKESLKKGAIDFINKPLAFEQMQEVFDRIENAINRDNKKVLIIEENPKHAKALAYFLETYHVNAKISDSFSRGIDDLKREEVDCVILDMGIPDEQAYSLMEKMKQDPAYEKIPVIVFTGKSFSKGEEAKIRRYADTIVIKTANSYQRILDEVSLFLHLVEENTKEKSGYVRDNGFGVLQEVLKGKKILVADDDVRNIFSLSRALEAQNIEVFSAVDGKEAIKKLEEHPDIDLVLMDIMMPEMDGYEAMKKIRRQHRFRNLPIIAVTAKAMPGDREKCIQSGASDYISKPVDIDQLLSLLRVWLYDKMV